MHFPMAHKVKKPQKYVPAVATDIRKTILKEKKRLEALKRVAG